MSDDENDDKDDKVKTFKGNKNIIKDLEKYNIPDDIKYQANDIFLRMNPKTHRGKKNIQRLFFCTYNAYKELNQVKDFNEICAIFDLKKGEGQKSLSLFSPLQTGYTPVIRNYTATDYIPSICSELNFSEETINDIKLLSDNILNRHKKLSEKNVVFLAKAIINYYININGIDIEFIITPTIKNIYNIIVELENK